MEEENRLYVSIDGTDFRIFMKKGWLYKYWYGYKFKNPGVRYEVGVSIKCGDIVWIHGPFACGFYNDIKIFRISLKNWLDEGECVEVDDGYVGESPKYVLCPKAIRYVKLTDERRKHEQRIRSRHETVNKRFK